VQYGDHIEIQDGGHQGVSQLGPDQKLIIQWSSISVPSFIISPQSEIFYHIFWLSRWTKWEHPEILAQSDPPPLIWASETFDRKLRLNGYRYRNGHNGEPIGNHHRSFKWCHRWPPTTSPSPKIEFHMPQDTRMAISPQRVIRYSSRLVLWFSGSADQIALFSVTSNPTWRQASILDNFEWPHLRNGSFDPLIYGSAHRAVIFAIAQLSCCRWH